MTSKIKHFNVGNHNTAIASQQVKAPTHRYIPSPDRIREWAHESNEGGRAQCWCCKVSFSMTHMRLCYVGFMKQELVCVDCKKLNAWQLAK
jgi:hypothetical protein